MKQENISRYSNLGDRASSPAIARLMNLALQKQGLLSLAVGFTDTRSLPVNYVRKALEELAERGNEPEWLQYGLNQGRPMLRDALARRLVVKDPQAGSVSGLARQCMITNGSQQALYLAVQTLCDPGDIILVERPTYFVFLEMLAGLGVQALSMPTREDGGIDIPELEKMLEQMERAGETRRLKAVYLVSYFSNPSSHSMGLKDKRELGSLLHRLGLILPVLEDAAYRDLYFRTPHLAPSVLAMPEWEDFPKLYLSTLTKSFATGLKIGYSFCSDETWLGKMLSVKGHQDFGSSNFAQALCEVVLVNGDFDMQLEKIRTLYRRKMEILHGILLGEDLDDKGWSWQIPSGGLYMWLKAPAGLDTGIDSKFCHECLEKGVMYVPGELCFGDAVPTNYLRLSFGVLEGRDLEEAGRRFATMAGAVGA